MRTLRFRAYDKYQNDIFDVLELDFVRRSVKTNYMGRFHNWIDMSDIVLLQFTGVCIKNAEVYEADLLWLRGSMYRVQYDEAACTYFVVGMLNPAEMIPLKDMVKIDECRIEGNYYTCRQAFR